jgi:uncharacterized protein YcbK (DUF882 family)
MRPIAIASVAAFLLLAADASAAPPQSRYFHHGDGAISVRSGAGSFAGRYRLPDGTHDERALRRINAVFMARYGDPAASISPRLIEFLDFIQDELAPGSQIKIASGYRSPEYNSGLRSSGRLAAKASLHQYGMAADVSLGRVPSARVWEFVRGLGFGGVGYYHGRLVHLDVGPARFWDETTSKVGEGISDDNKLIGLVADRDIYLPGEEVELRFIRMTAFPIGVERTFALERQDGEKGWREAAKFEPSIPPAAGCPSFSSIAQMAGLRWRLPAGLAPGRYRVRASFCDRRYDEMPSQVETPEFEVVQP